MMKNGSDVRKKERGLRCGSVISSSFQENRWLPAAYIFTLQNNRVCRYIL